MAGFSNQPRDASKYARFKEGKIINGDDEYTNLTGKVIDLDIVDEVFNKQEYRKIVLLLDIGTMTPVELGFSLSSGYGNAFCCIMPNIDWSKEIDLCPGFEKPKDSTMNGRGKLFIRQDDKPLKWYYTNDTDDKTKRPAPKETKVKGKPSIFDFSKRNEFYETKLMKARELIVKESGGFANWKPAPVPAGEQGDDLPF